MVPDYISEKKMRELKLSKGETAGHGDVYTCMGCRSFLTPDRSGNGWNNVANAGNYEPGKPEVLRPVQPGRRDDQSGRRGAVLRRRAG